MATPRWTLVEHCAPVAEFVEDEAGPWVSVIDHLRVEAERDRLLALVNSPQTIDFLEATRLEVVHQIERWGTVGDRAKRPADWFWLLGYLAGKALAAHIAGDVEKAKHHTISSAAALANWHAHITLGGGAMTPGSSDVQRMLEEAFGSSITVR